jgi:archaellum component FlaC
MVFRHRGRERWPLVAAVGISVLIAGGITAWSLHAKAASRAVPPEPDVEPTGELLTTPSSINNSLVAYPHIMDVFRGDAVGMERASATGVSGSTSDASGAATELVQPSASPARSIGDESSLALKNQADLPAPPAVTLATAAIEQQERPRPKQPPAPPAAAAVVPNDDDEKPTAPRGADPTYASTEPAEAPKLAAFEAAIREMLDRGWNAKQSGMDAAQESFRTADALCPRDPRAEYALGLVYLKHSKYEEALKRFTETGENKHPYIPAYRAAVWVRVLRSSYEPAALELVKFVRAWREIDSMPDWVASDLAIWTGRMMGYLAGPVDSRSVDALIDKCGPEISDSLRPDLRALYKSARNDVLEEYAAKANAQERTRMEAKRDQERSAEDARARLDAEAAQSKQDRKQVEKSADDLEKNLKDQLTGIDNELNALDRNYDRIQVRMRTVTNTLQSLDYEISNLNSQRNQLLAEQNTGSGGTGSGGTTKPGVPKPPPPISTPNSAQILFLNTSIDQKTRDRVRLQLELDRLDVTIRETQRQGAGLLKRRQSLINEYQSASGKLYKERDSLSNREKFLDRKKQEASKPATGSTAQVKALAQSAKALKTYVDLNLELEKQRVLDSFEGAK